MSKEKVYIVLSHKNSLKIGTKDQWEVTETVEFVNQLRNRHYTKSSAIGDYLNQKMIAGSRYGFTDYEKFNEYIRKKYSKQMTELDSAYKAQVNVTTSSNLFVDSHGNLRAKTVFD